MTRTFPSILIVVAALALPCVARGQDAPKPEPPKQVYCPVTPEEEIDSEVFTEYEGKRVYFCCERCRARFLRDSQRYATRLIIAGAPVEKQPPPPTTPAAPPQPTHEHEPKAPAAAPTGEAGHGPAEHDHNEAPAHSGGAEHGHESHAHGHGPAWINWIGRFHPAAVNFPIGVIVAGVFAEALFMMTRRPLYSQAARYCVWFGVLTGVLAGLLGWCFGGFHFIDSDWLLTVHRWQGTGTVLCLLALLWATERAHREPACSMALYRVLLAGSAALVTVTGFFGGSMVYGLDHYVRP
jgi:uncharacterized membrane protein/YHS domain-containing protein